MPSATAGEGDRRSELLPNLAPLAPDELFPPATGLMPQSMTTVVPFVIDGCLPEETVRTGARRCLRFDTRVLNSGKGPLEVAYLVDGATVSAMQRIYLRDGSFVERPATTSEFHPTHTHFHIKDFYVSHLWRRGTNGKPVGKPVATTLKNGFCPEDSERYTAMGEANYGCRSDFETDDGIRQIVGISAGWLDTYGYNLPDQFVEISDVPDGRYVLQIVIDPNNEFRESDETDNAVCVAIGLSGDKMEVGRASDCRLPSGRTLRDPGRA